MPDRSIGSRFVIGPDVALRLAEEDALLRDGVDLLAPTLMRSQVLSALYAAARRGEISRGQADRRLDYVRRLRVRLLGDRVVQRVAWTIAEDLGWPDTFDAEYVALTRLQADAFVTLDGALARTLSGVVPLAPVDALR